MEIKFTIDPDVDADDYRELYTSQVTMEDGTSFIVRANEDEVSYDEFRADIFEDLFRSLAESTGLDVTVEEDDYATFDLDDIQDCSAVDSYEDYVADEDRSGC